MSELEFKTRSGVERVGLKGSGAAEWLAAHGIAVPAAPNTWVGCGADALGTDAARMNAETFLVARLGTSEFFLEDSAGGGRLRGIEPAPEAHPPSVYPVLREDASFLLSGKGSLEVLAQVCNVNFSDLRLDARPVIMTSMVGVSVLVVPQFGILHGWHRIWCDPSFGHYLEDALRTVVIECGGNYRGGVSA